MIKKMLSVGIGVEEIFKHMVVDEYYWDQNTINLFRHVHPFSRIPILPVYKLQANGVFFLTMLLCQIFSNVFSQWHMYGIGVVLLVALNDLVGSEAPTILRNFLQRFKSTKEEQTHIYHDFVVDRCIYKYEQIQHQTTPTFYMPKCFLNTYIFVYMYSMISLYLFMYTSFWNWNSKIKRS